MAAVATWRPWQGALAGGYAGNQVQKNMQHNDTYTTSGKRCRNVSKTEGKAAGYDVRYRFDGKESVVRTDYIPVNRIPVKDGKLVLANSEQGTGNVQKWLWASSSKLSQP